MTSAGAGSVSVVLPAAGLGERCGMRPAKQFQKILGRPLFEYTLQEFCNVESVTHILMVVQPDLIEQVMKMIEDGQYKNSCATVSVVAGDTSRHRSIQNALTCLKESEPEHGHVVLVHDVVRPICEPPLVEDVVANARKYGACGVIRPSVSTVLKVEAENNHFLLSHSCDRSSHFASEMPQAFRWHVIRDMYSKANDFDLDYGTECLDLAIRYANVKPALITGPTYLGKVTYEKDLISYATLIKERNLRTVQLLVSSESETEFDSNCLSSAFQNVHERHSLNFWDNSLLRSTISDILTPYSSLIFCIDSQAVFCQLITDLVHVLRTIPKWLGAVLLLHCPFQANNSCFPLCSCQQPTCEFLASNKLVSTASNSGTVVAFLRGPKINASTVRNFIQFRNLPCSGTTLTYVDTWE